MAQHSDIARTAIMTNATIPDLTPLNNDMDGNGISPNDSGSQSPTTKDATLAPPPRNPAGRGNNVMPADATRRGSKDGVGIPLSDTPQSTAPSSPQL